MKADCEQQYLAEAYRSFLQSVTDSADALPAADDGEPQDRLNELDIQGLWATGIFGNEGETVRHGHLRILDFGEWNRSSGPDFRYAEIEINGKKIRGDIEIDPRAQDWERHGHGVNPSFNNVVLHVVLSAPPVGWFTRNSLHMEVPIYYLSPEVIQSALDMERAPSCANLQTPMCRKPMEKMSPGLVAQFLQAVAAFRLSIKRKQFKRKILVLGENQAWYEAWADTLGYSKNRRPMLTLARRAPLRSLGKSAEAILLGVAGFLMPVLPSRTTAEAREYHRKVWDTWWKIKDGYALADQRMPEWNFAGIRPLNHPHRRVAALALLAEHWNELIPLFNAANAERLTSTLLHMRHPFWDHQSMIDAQPLSRSTALIGRERIGNFLSNYVYVHDATPTSYSSYLRLRAGSMSSRVTTIARHLFGERTDIRGILSFEYAHQALLQIGADFCASHACRDCLFPTRLRHWNPHDLN